jgi:hypothetical protein
VRGPTPPVPAGDSVLVMDVAVLLVGVLREGYELRQITVRNPRGLLVGIFPFMVEFRSVYVGRLLFLGTGLSYYLDVIVRAGWEDKVLESGGQALKELECWHIADLQQLRPEAAAWGIRRW